MLEDTLLLFSVDLIRVRFVFDFFFRNLVTSCSLGVVVDLPVKDNDADSISLDAFVNFNQSLC